MRAAHRSSSRWSRGPAWASGGQWARDIRGTRSGAVASDVAGLRASDATEEEWPVKPPAQPTLVQTQHPPRDTEGPGIRGLQSFPGLSDLILCGASKEWFGEPLASMADHLEARVSGDFREAALVGALIRRTYGGQKPVGADPSRPSFRPAETDQGSAAEGSGDPTSVLRGRWETRCKRSSLSYANRRLKSMQLVE